MNGHYRAAAPLQAWQTTKTCENASGPKECKASQQWSCLQALREIVPAEARRQASSSRNK
jgi:hypothetical protein